MASSSPRVAAKSDSKVEECCPGPVAPQARMLFPRGSGQLPELQCATLLLCWVAGGPIALLGHTVQALTTPTTTSMNRSASYVRASALSKEIDLHAMDKFVCQSIAPDQEKYSEAPTALSLARQHSRD